MHRPHAIDPEPDQPGSRRRNLRNRLRNVAGVRSVLRPATTLRISAVAALFLCFQSAQSAAEHTSAELAELLSYVPDDWLYHDPYRDLYLEVSRVQRSPNGQLPALYFYDAEVARQAISRAPMRRGDPRLNVDERTPNMHLFLTELWRVAAVPHSIRQAMTRQQRDYWQERVGFDIDNISSVLSLGISGHNWTILSLDPAANFESIRNSLINRYYAPLRSDEWDIYGYDIGYVSVEQIQSDLLSGHRSAFQQSGYRSYVATDGNVVVSGQLLPYLEVLTSAAGPDVLDLPEVSLLLTALDSDFLLGSSLVQAVLFPPLVAHPDSDAEIPIWLVGMIADLVTPVSDITAMVQIHATREQAEDSLGYMRSGLMEIFDQFEADGGRALEEFGSYQTFVFGDGPAAAVFLFAVDYAMDNSYVSRNTTYTLFFNSFRRSRRWGPFGHYRYQFQELLPW